MTLRSSAARSCVLDVVLSPGEGIESGRRDECTAEVRRVAVSALRGDFRDGKGRAREKRFRPRHPRGDDLLKDGLPRGLAESYLRVAARAEKAGEHVLR